jgi:orotate phosphoribosyltransferase
VRESIAMIEAAGGTPCGVAIALDRQERATRNDGGELPYSAVQFVTAELKLDVVAVATLVDLLQYLSSTSDASLARHAASVAAYRERYGV